MAALQNVRHETAAQLIAEDRQTDQQIAAAVGVSRRTIAYWKLRPEIKSRISEICEVAAARMESRMERHEWLWERDCLRREASTSKSAIARRVAFQLLQEMGAS
jgi:Homeodomain-like domain